MKSWRVMISIILFFVFFVYGCVSPAPGTHEGRGKPRAKVLSIRVAVAKNIERLDIVSRNALLISKGQRFKLPASATLSAKEGYITFHDVSYPLPVSLTSSHIIQMNGKPYFGELVIQDGLVINILPLEEYLKGVLSQEMAEAWPVEALKAQAVVSRTYALKKMLENRDSLYDIERSEIHQKFEYETRNERINTAITKTHGIIVLYQNEPIEAFFHSCSGGRTENCRDVFQKDIPYLRSIPDPYCSRDERFFWAYTIDSEMIMELLKEILDKDRQSLSLRDVRIDSKTGSGRVKEFRLVFENGSGQTVRGNLFRLALDSKALKSLLIQRIEKKKSTRGWTFTFSGRGYGHGVGLSQWGAKRMAEQGFDYRKILSYYYRRTYLGTYRSFSFEN